MNSTRKLGFTLVELLIVIAILAVLAVAVVLVINPVQLVKAARDSTRLSDAAALNSALALYNTDVASGFMGTSTYVYVSIPDSSATCANLGLPTLPSGQYNCVTSSTLRKTDGTGWVPVNFSSLTFGNPLPNLPVDPVNTTSTGNYYTYTAGGGWAVSAVLESTKQTPTMVSDGGRSTNAYEVGSNLALTPTSTLERFVAVGAIPAPTYGTVWSDAGVSSGNIISVAMSSDGTRITAVKNGYSIYVSTNTGASWTPIAINTGWYDVAMSSSGQYQTAVPFGNYIYVSNDYGASFHQAPGTNGQWKAVAMSSSGQIQAVEATGMGSGQIYISTNYGENWSLLVNSPIKNWGDIAMSSLGNVIVASVNFSNSYQADQIYVSENQGTSWTAYGPTKNWRSVAISSDGTKQIATALTSDQIYYSTNTGHTWSSYTNPIANNWYGVAMSANGQILTAVGLIGASSGYIYISTDSGSSWTTPGSTTNNYPWYATTMSSDGTKQAVVGGGPSYPGLVWVSTH